MGNAARPSAELLDRADELARIDELASSAAADRGGLVLVEGVAGIGKTTLVGSAADRTGDRGLRVLRACGSELEQAFAFGAVRQLFEPLVARLAEAERAALFSGPAARVEPVVSGDVGAPREELGSFGVLHGLYWLTANAAAATPLFVAVDDAQWLDRPSLRFLAYLARRVDDLPVGLLVAARTGEPGAPEDLLDELRDQAGDRRLHPAPLGPDAVAAVVRAQLPGADDALCAACRAASAGNPFYLRELLRAAAMDGLRPGPAAVERVEQLSIPSVGDRVVRRIARLGAEATALAGAMAVLGGGRLPDAARVAKLDDDEAAAAASGLVKIEVLAAEDPFAFVHPVVRRSVYAALSRAERDEAHLAAAGRLAARDAPPDAVAAHLLAAPPRGTGWVVDTLRAAAARALADAAPESAADLLRRALEEPPGHEQRPAVLREVAAAETRTADARAIAHLAEAREALGEPRERGRIALELGRAWMTLSEFEQAAGVLATALDEFDGHDDALADVIRGEHYGLTMLDLHAVAARLPELTALCDEVGTRARDRTLTAIAACVALFRNRPARECAALAEQALGIGEMTGAGWNGTRIALSVLINAEEYESARTFLDAALEAARAEGDTNILSATYMLLAWRAQALGALADAEAYSDQQAEVVRSAASFRVAYGVSGRASLHLDRGETAEAARLIAQVAPLGSAPATEWPATAAFVGLLGTRGRARLAEGRTREAIEDFERVLQAEPRDAGLWLPPTVEARVPAAMAYLAAGEPERARELGRVELERARVFAAPRALGVALRTVGLVEQDLDLLEESVAVLERSPARLEHARSLVEWGAALRRANRRAAAREHLEAGMEAAHRCGAAPVAERAREELRATGARPRRLVRTGVEALTASELRVAKLASAGRKNAEIAQELYISLKTVEMHLSRAYAKLDLSGRGARERLGDSLKRAG